MLTKKLTILAILLPTFVFHQTPAAAQDSLLLRDYRFVKRQDAWLTSPNAAGLTSLRADNIAQAELSLTKADGWLTDYYQSPDVLQADAAVEAFCRLTPRTVVYGAISYGNFSGKSMTGSVFIDPTRRPFNIVEDSLTNPGTKHRDTYSLSGGVGVDVLSGLALGARLDYTAANYAKYKDLRHKNKLMDLRMSLGLTSTFNFQLSTFNLQHLGAYYTYHRNTESISFGTYGKSEKVYKSLIDYGGFFGIVEQFGNEGYTDKSHEMPLLTDGNTFGLQADIRVLPHLTFYNEVFLTAESGYYGRKSPFTITYTTHEARSHGYRGQLSLQLPPSTRHQLSFSYVNEKLANKANTFRELTNETSATYYEYFDPVETGDKQWDDFDVSYTGDYGISGELPRWTLQAGYHYTERKQASYLYPLYRHQELHIHQLSASATRRFVCPKGVWSVHLGLAYQTGSGEPYQDFTFQPSTSNLPPSTMEVFLARECHYLTASQYTLGGSVEYAFVFPGTRLKTYARGAVSHRAATETCDYSDNNHRTQATLTLGCTF